MALRGVFGSAVGIVQVRTRVFHFEGSWAHRRDPVATIIVGRVFHDAPNVKGNR